MKSGRIIVYPKRNLICVIFQQIIKNINLASSYMWTMNTFKHVIHGSLVQNAVLCLIT